MLLNVWLMNICDAAYQRVILCNPSTIINHSQPSNNIILRKYFQGSKHKYFCGHRELINPTILWWNVGVCLNLSDHIKQLESEPDFHSTMSQSKNIFFFYLKEKEKKKMLLQIFAGNGKKRTMRRSEIILTLLMSPSELVWESDTHTHNITNTAASQYLQYQSLV